MSAWADTLVVLTGAHISDECVAAMEEEIERMLGLTVTGKEIGEAVRWMSDRDLLEPRRTPSAAAIVSAIRALREPRAGTEADGGYDISAYTRRLDAIAAGRQGCNPNLPRRRHVASACGDCDREPAVQAWCVICQPTHTKLCRMVHEYADRIGVAYQRTDVAALAR